MSKRVILTGASGFTGQYVLEELLKCKYEVIAVGRKKPANPVLNCQWEEMDLQNLQLCENLVRYIQPEAIIHLAAQNNIVVSQEQPEETIKQNFLLMLNLLNAVRLHSPKTKCILAGSAAVYKSSSNKSALAEDASSDITNAYALTKSLQEQTAMLYVKEYGLDIVCTRPFNYVGYRQGRKTFVDSVCRQISEIAKGRRENVLRVGNLEVYRDFSDVRDVARAYVLMLERNIKPGIYNISSGTATCLKDIVNYLCSKYDGQIEVIQESALMRKNDVQYLCGDNTKIKECIQWEAEYHIFDTIDWMYEKMMEE